ncbi:MAG TPA: pyruvate carboxylase [Solirubrobacteraceae bacterium]|jgi:pyruvate carboxylase|nr:pyruvate carboxylase [Solirubrobacteraceae bacterium]
MFKKVLVANRGEIAVRAFRAAYELGIASAALYTPDDRGSVHRVKADEAYEVGEAGHPVRAYLDVELVVGLAQRIGADAIYPGYGFMSENPELARACARAGITFVGPPAQVLAAAGNKVRAREAARRAGVPVLRASEILADPADAAAAAEGMSFPLFVKAAEGGGGRGMRLVANAPDLEEAARSAMREAEGAFGDPSVYLEEALVRPRHIEVQILADAEGNVVHLFERDCSVQRRHQKVIELAPAPNLDPDLRDRLCADAVRFAREVSYVNAGTVEFLVDPERGEHVFIEMNPRIQVEHTVTEETTDVDLVRSQLLIAGGATLPDLGLRQEGLHQRGVALQCRITTEDPSADFRPDTGRISAYRAPGGAGIRLDEGNAYVGAEISPYFDSLLLKVTARGEDLRTAIARARRAVDEVRVRGVSTNQAFLRAVLDDPDFRAGKTYTTFVDEHPGLTAVSTRGDRASRLLRRLAEVTVNSPNGPAPQVADPASKLPTLPEGDPPPGSRQRLEELGPAGFARWMREETALQVTDTTLRDAHQSLLATRMRTYDMAVVSPYMAYLLPEMFSLEVWGGATYDVALRFLSEDPWERLALLRERLPNLCLQMLLRGRNLLGYEPYSEAAVRAFVAEATATGIDIFRIFDALNNVEPMRAAIDATIESGAVAEAAVCYTGDLSDPAERVYTLDYYLRIAEGLVKAGAHILAIKDMAGLLRAPAARTLVTRLRDEFDLPVHLHTHDTAGGQLATYLAAIEAGVDAVDGAADPMAGRTSQPTLSGIVSATDFTERKTGLSLGALLDLEPYWEAVRTSYSPFETRMRAPTGRVYRHQIPGGQLTNLRQQSIALGLGERFEEIEAAYVRANELLGNIVKVTPTSKVVGDLALFVVSGAIDWVDLREHPERFDLPDSVLAFLRGELGEPAGGLPQPFAERALRGASTSADEDDSSEGEDTHIPEAGPERRAALSELMFPGPFRDQREAREHYGDVSVIPTLPFFYGLKEDEEHAIDLEPGVRLMVGLEAIGEPDARGMRTVLTRLNGQLRPLDVRDESIQVTSAAVERADPKNPDHVATPLAGVITVKVKEGDEVTEGDPIAVLEAMKMESTITAPHAGRVARVAATNGSRLEHGDLILVLESAGA